MVFIREFKPNNAKQWMNRSEWGKKLEQPRAKYHKSTKMIDAFYGQIYSTIPYE